MIVITGASGKTGSQIADLLLQRGEQVRVVGRSEKRLRQLTERGAFIALGDQGDRAFLAEVFTGADAVYLLIPPKLDAADVRAYYNMMGDAAVEAIKRSGVKKVVFLSSLGAELDSGTGPVAGLHDVEAKLEALEQIDLVILRPGYFMENTLWNIPLIKRDRINANATSPDAPFAMIATKDIAEKAADLLASRDFTGHNIIDLYGDKITYRQASRLIGEAVGLPDLPYVQASDEDAFKGLKAFGLSDSTARSFVELSHALSNGKIHLTQIGFSHPNTPTRFRHFVKETFLPAYRQAR